MQDALQLLDNERQGTTQSQASQSTYMPCQSTFLLNLISISFTEAVLTTMDGKHVTIPLTFDVRSKRHKNQNVGKNGSQRGRKVFLGLDLTIRDLGIVARRELGLPGRTPLHVTTRIVQNFTALPKYRPLATFVAAKSLDIVKAYSSCFFCGEQLEHHKGGVAFEGPFNYCYFCEDAPAWHHGACCPHNWNSKYCRGLTHTERYEMQMHFGWCLQEDPPQLVE